MKSFGVTGWKNTGKTGLMERLIATFRAQGVSVSTIKRTHHDVDMDREGTDSFRHRAAGAEEVVLASDRRWVLQRETADPYPLQELLARLSPVDLVLIEGFKSAPHLKIETYRNDAGTALIAPQNPSIVAIAADCPVSSPLPKFDLDDTEKIAMFIRNKVGLIS